MTDRSERTGDDMDLSLATADIEAQARARAFAETWLLRTRSRATSARSARRRWPRSRRTCSRYKLNGFNHTKEDGGHGYTPLQQILICEELGKATNGLWTVVLEGLDAAEVRHREAAQGIPHARSTPARAAPATRSPSRDAGSDPRMVKTTAVKKKGKWVITGEKWFVTSADASHCHPRARPCRRRSEEADALHRRQGCAGREGEAHPAVHAQLSSTSISRWSSTR